MIGIPILIIGAIVALLLFYIGRQAYWAKQVLTLCAQDGGVHVNERFPISQTAFDALPKLDGKFIDFPIGKAGVFSPLYGTMKQSYIRSRNPEVYQLETVVRRWSDDKIMGKIIRYTRRGGDIPSWAHPSSFTCPEQAEIYAGKLRFYEIQKNQ